MSESREIAGEIRRKAIELGFSACGFAPADSLSELEEGFRDWLSAGKAGDMNYLTRNIDLRLDPRKLVDGAKTVISLAAPYYSPLPPPVAGSGTDIRRGEESCICCRADLSCAAVVVVVIDLLVLRPE